MRVTSIDADGRLRIEATAGKPELLHSTTGASSGDTDVVVGASNEVVVVESLVCYNSSASPVTVTLELGATGSEVPFFARQLVSGETYTWNVPLVVDSASTLVVNCGTGSAINILALGRTHSYG